MQRRNFLIGLGGTAIGGSALIGSGAFSRVESQRQVNIAVATDDEAYLGLVPLDTPNSRNYVATDEYGHLYVQIDGEGNQQGEGPSETLIGQGVNSNSRTYFEGMFDICNNGKATAEIWIDVAQLEFHDSSEDGINTEGEPIADVQYYDEDEEEWVSILRDSSDDSWQPDAGVELEVGECVTVRIVTSTFGIDATTGQDLVSGTAIVNAVSEEAGQSVPE